MILSGNASVCRNALINYEGRYSYHDHFHVSLHRL